MSLYAFGFGFLAFQVLAWFGTDRPLWVLVVNVIGALVIGALGFAEWRRQRAGRRALLHRVRAMTAPPCTNCGGTGKVEPSVGVTSDGDTFLYEGRTWCSVCHPEWVMPEPDEPQTRPHP